MAPGRTSAAIETSATVAQPKQRYTQPTLTQYGTVKTLTASGTALPLETTNPSGGNPTPTCSNDGNRKLCTASDRSIKENILCVDRHPLGIGLYLFEYSSSYQKEWGHGRQFGVMADEVERVMPEAVSLHADGYKLVNYAMLGINRTLQ
jgi:hypothetical protein